MIEIKINENKDDFYIEVKGHAEYAECGKDIVCAGVTALVQAFDKCIKASKLNKESAFKQGFFAVHCKKSEEVKNYIKMLQEGFLHIQEYYPENVKVIINKL